jgi:hypothetical protein
MSEAAGTRKNWKLRWALALGVLALAALLLPPLVNINRYKQRIAVEIGASLGRTIHFSSVKLRLLPRPGFVIENFQVEEDPNFGNEPSLRAQTVLASVSPASLWHERLEISRISMDEASVNLTRNENEEWNLASLLQRQNARQHASGLVSGLPASSPLAEVTPPRLPYVVMTNTRINLKLGVDKLPFSLTDAEATLWLEKPGIWRFRLRGQPIRTDVPVVPADTGEIRLEGSVGDGKPAAANLLQLPFSLKGEWSGAQLGQLTRILLGRDAGWRGDLRAEAEFKGTATQVQMHTRLRAQEVRREGLDTGQPLDFDAVCDATYERPDHLLTSTLCDSPIGKGHIRLEGSYPLQSGAGTPNLSLKVEQVPAQAPLDLLRTLRSEFAPNLKAEGLLNGQLHYAQPADANESALTGEIVAEGLRLSGDGLAAPLVLPALRFHSPVAEPVRKHSRSQDAPTAHESLVLDPVSVLLGNAAPLWMSAMVDTQGYQLTLNGSAGIDALLNDARALQITPRSLDLPLSGGSAEVDLTAAGMWVPRTEADAEPKDTVVGKLHLHKTKLSEPFLAVPVEIDDLAVLFQPDSVDWNWADNAVRFGTVAPITPKGSVHLSLACSEADCRPSFDLTFDRLDLSNLQRTLLGATKPETLLSELLDKIERTPAAPAWPAMTGSVKIATLTLEKFTAKNVVADASFAGRALTLEKLQGDALGGKFAGSLTLDAISGKPEYALDLDLKRIRGSELAGLFGAGVQLPFAPEGYANLTVKGNASGFADDQLTGSATGIFDWDWSKGRFKLDEKSLTRFDHWKGSGSLSGNQLRIPSSMVGPHKQSVQGSIMLWPKTVADLKVARP